MTLFPIHVLPYDLTFLIIPVLIFLNRALENKDKNACIAFILANVIFILPNLVIGDTYAISPLILFIMGLYLLLKRGSIINFYQIFILIFKIKNSCIDF